MESTPPPTDPLPTRDDSKMVDIPIVKREYLIFKYIEKKSTYRKIFVFVLYFVFQFCPPKKEIFLDNNVIEHHFFKF